MAKKKYSSPYKEKVYYDNTIFRGIMATTDPNQEGYFKQLINFDIDDTGQSLIPRKGILQTGLHLNDAEHTAVVLDPETTVYYKDHDTEYYIFIDINNILLDSLHSKNIYDLVKNITQFESFDTLYASYKSAVSNHQVHEWADSYTDGVLYLSNNLLNYMDYLDEHIDNEPDFISSTINTFVCYKSTLSLENKYFIASTIEHIDAINNDPNDNTIYFHTWLNQFSNISKIDIIDSHYAQYVIDTNSIGKNIIKIKITYNTTNYVYAWIEFKYNAIKDTLVISVVNTDNTYAIDMSSRNLASNLDIIPNPVARIYSTLNEAHEAGVWYNKFPIIYAHKNDKYLINYTSDLFDLQIQPSYFLLPPDTGNKWVYTYDIYSTNKYAIERNDTVYNANGLFDLTTNSPYSPVLYTDVYMQSMYDVYGPATAGIAYTAEEEHIVTLNGINTLYTNIDSVLPNTDTSSEATYIITVVPECSEDILDTTHVTFDFLNDTSNTFTTKPCVIERMFKMLFSSVQVSQSSYRAYQGISTFNTYEEYLDCLPLFTNIDIYETLEELLTTADYFKNSKYYISKKQDINKQLNVFSDGRTGSITEYYKHIENINTLNSYDTALNSPILVTTDAGMSNEELLKYIKENISFAHFVLKPMFTGQIVYVSSDVGSSIQEYYFERTVVDHWYDASNSAGTQTVKRQAIAMSQLFPELTNPNKLAESKKYYVYTNITKQRSELIDDDDLLHKLFYEFDHSYQETYGGSTVHDYYYYPCVYRHFNDNTTTDTLVKPYIHEFIYPLGTSLPVSNYNYSLSASPIYSALKNRGYFDQGLIMSFYLMQIPTSADPDDLIDNTIPYGAYERNKLINSTNLIQSLNITIRDDADNDEANQVERILKDDPTNIRGSKNWCIFYSTEGYRLVTWTNNIVYMSEANTYGYFKQENKKTYPEEVLKVLPYKDKLLVFTTQNMYAIFPYEYTVQVENGKDDNGDTKYVQQTIITYNTLPVLYNLYTDRKYLNVIKIYNSMVLYYSTQGQLYLIAPTATVDSDTMYTLKYVNQAANDILLNYDVYINKRLQVYGLEPITKDDVIINADVSISYIKIFYSIPTKNYTYILLYDIINNRYTVYDTNTFGVTTDVVYTDLGAVVVSKDWNNHLSLCTQYKEPNILDNNYDLYTLDNYSFETQPLNTEIDTGIIFLNNHLRKRFRSFTTIYKNLNASTLQYTLNVYVDDVRMIHTAMGNNVEIKNVNDLIDPQKIISSVQLLEYNTVLFDFSDFTSNKILSHISSIPSIGKNIELQMRFKASGSYKLQGFGLIYKEHSV